MQSNLMSYSFEKLTYHWIRLEICLFNKWRFGFDIGREERREIAHEAYKRMTQASWSGDTDGIDLRNMSSLPDIEKKHIAECKKRVAERKKSANIEVSKQWWKNAIGMK